MTTNESPVFRFALREDLKNDKRFLPVRATPGSAGWDVSCAFEDHKDLTLWGGEYVKIPLGIRCILPTGWWLSLKPRSSSFIKKKLHALYGTIDFDFRGYLQFIARYENDMPIELKFGERIGQLIPVKLKEMIVEEISNEEFDAFVESETDNIRKEKGFGSSDARK